MTERLQPVRVQFIGCGDAFASGGRFNTCFHVTGAGTNFLIDCGASSLVAMKRAQIDRNAVGLILFTHYHHDHFGGVPFFIEDAQLVAKRERPLLLAGPPSLPARYATMMEAAFPGSSQNAWRFPLSFREVEIGKHNDFGAFAVTPFHVKHDDRAGPCLAYRIEIGGRIIAFSGDTEWTDALIEAGRGADLFICECYVYDKAYKGHMSLSILREKLAGIAPKRLILTHMSDDMLGRLGDVPYETAEDGMVVEI